MTLVILAAGLGSRYGGLKQLDPMTENGEFIIDFSVYDAVLAGFDKVVFIIKKENLDDFEETIGSRVRKHIKVEYAFQDINDIPAGFTVPEGREKPWGTTHALLSTRNVVDDNFVVINADDFYGRDMFMTIADHLKTAKTENGVSHSCMVGYVLKNTLTEHGTVSRGVCVADENGMLTDIVETLNIILSEDGSISDANAGALSPELPVSMKMWGFTPKALDLMESAFKAFLSNIQDGDIKAEYPIPTFIGEAIDNHDISIKVYTTDATWFGVTYAEDRPQVVKNLQDMKDNKTYPRELKL